MKELEVIAYGVENAIHNYLSQVSLTTLEQVLEQLHDADTDLELLHGLDFGYLITKVDVELSRRKNEIVTG